MVLNSYVTDRYRYLFVDQGYFFVSAMRFLVPVMNLTLHPKSVVLIPREHPFV